MKILIVKTSSLGDILHAFPVVERLHQKYPEAEIDWVVEQTMAELVKAHPYVHEILIIQTKMWKKNLWKKEGWSSFFSFRRLLRKEKYDMVIDLQGNIKSGLITWMAKSPIKVGFGYSTVPEWPNALFTNRRYNPPIGKNIRDDYLFMIEEMEEGNSAGITLNVSPQEKRLIDQILSAPELQGGEKIMICPGSNWTNKQLSKESLLALLKKIYRGHNCSFLFVWGSEAEKRIVEELALAFPHHCLITKKMSLPALQNLMGRVELVIAMDSLPLHLAGTTATPVYGIFGASSAHKYLPKGSQSFQGKCPYNKTFEKRCPILRTCPTGSCIKDLDVNLLYSDLEAYLAKHRSHQDF